MCDKYNRQGPLVFRRSLFLLDNSPDKSDFVSFSPFVGYNVTVTNEETPRGERRRNGHDHF